MKMSLQSISRVSGSLKSFKLSSTLSFFKGVIFALGLCVGVGAVLAAPPGNPPTCPLTNPACNPPVHTGTENQIKTGGLWVNGTLGVGSLIVGTAPTTVGQPLVATDTTGGVGWGAVSAGSDNLIIKTGSASVTPCTNTNSCVKNISFSAPFPTGATPILVTAQPMWTRDNGGEHSTWRIDSPTHSGFTFTMTQPTSGTNNGVGTVMWSAYFDPTEYNSTTLDTASCRGVVVTSGFGPKVEWYVSAPNAYKEVAVRSVTNSTFYFASGLTAPVVDYNFTTDTLNNLSPVPHGTYTRSFLVKDIKEVFKTVTCSVVAP